MASPTDLGCIRLIALGSSLVLTSTEFQFRDKVRMVVETQWKSLTLEICLKTDCIFCQRTTDARGFVRIGRWKIYVEEGLPRVPIQLSHWDGQLRAEYQSQILAEYQCKWGKKSARPTAISHPRYRIHPFQSRQMALFDPLWVRDPVEPDDRKIQRP